MYAPRKLLKNVEAQIWKQICTSMFAAVLLPSAKKQPNTITNQWLNKWECSHSTQFHSHKEQWHLTFVPTCIGSQLSKSEGESQIQIASLRGKPEDSTVGRCGQHGSMPRHMSSQAPQESCLSTESGVVSEYLWVWLKNPFPTPQKIAKVKQQIEEKQQTRADWKGTSLPTHLNCCFLQSCW